jgi:hypothetical protein
MRNVADTIIRNMRLSPTESERAEFVRELEAARDFSLEPIKNGTGDN